MKSSVRSDIFIDNHYATIKLHRSGMLFLGFTCRSDGAKVLYITFFYKHFTPTGLFFKKTKVLQFFFVRFVSSWLNLLLLGLLHHVRRTCKKDIITP